MISEPKKELNEETPASVNEAGGVPLFRFHPDPQLPTSDSCSLNELLQYHDRAFVQHAYAVVLRRTPTTSELTTTLSALRDGQRGKIEIIEALVASQKVTGPRVVVNGLPSPALRKLSRVPVIGYVFRILRAMTRLPLMMQDQQRFESYALAQQQRLADFLNEEIVPAVKKRAVGRDLPAQGTTLADAVDTVLMLSDSVVELAGKQNELAENVVRYQSQLKQIESQLTAVETAQRELQSSFERLAQQPKELQAQLVKLQEQREQSEQLVHEDVVQLTKAVQVLQKEFEGLNRESANNIAAQREFLVQEQQLIVEAQKVALAELELQISDVQRMTEEVRENLARLDNTAGVSKPE